MRTPTGSLATKFREDVTTFARLFTFTLANGRTLRFTDLDSDVVVGTTLFRANPGFTASAILSAIRTQASGLEIVTTIDGEIFVLDEVLAGGLDDADVLLEVVDYAEPDGGSMILFGGTVGDVEHDNNDNLTVEINGRFSRDRSLTLEVYQQTCRVDLGSPECGFDILSLQRSFTVQEVRSATTFTTAELDDAPALGQPFWALGMAQFRSGDNNGIALEVRTSDPADRSVTLFTPVPFALAVGDVGVIVPGCDKSFTTCRQRYGRQVSFRAEPFHPEEFALWGGRR